MCVPDELMEDDNSSMTINECNKYRLATEISLNDVYSLTHTH